MASKHYSYSHATVASSTKLTFPEAARNITIRNMAGGTGGLFFTLDPAATAADNTMFKLAPGESYEYKNDARPLDHLYYIGEGTGATISVYAH